MGKSLFLNKHINFNVTTVAHQNRCLLMALFLVFPSFVRAEETDVKTKDTQITWAIMPQLNLNMPGNWKTLKSTDSNISYGGGLGINCGIKLKYDWLINTGFSICYDNLHISESYISAHPIDLERWSAPLSISLGHSFIIFDEVEIIPLASVEASYCFSNKISDRNDMHVYNWNPFNISWGIGCGLGLNDKYEIDIVGYFGLPHLIRQSNNNLYDNKVRMSFKYYF